MPTRPARCLSSSLPRTSVTTHVGIPAGSHMAGRRLPVQGVGNLPSREATRQVQEGCVMYLTRILCATEGNVHPFNIRIAALCWPAEPRPEATATSRFTAVVFVEA